MKVYFQWLEYNVITLRRGAKPEFGEADYVEGVGVAVPGNNCWEIYREGEPMRRKRTLNLWDLETGQQRERRFPKLEKKAPSWLKDPFLRAMRAAKIPGPVFGPPAVGQGQLDL